MSDLVPIEPAGPVAVPTPVVEAPPVRRTSERVIINGPMSFAGAAQRSMRLRRGNLPSRIALTLVALAVMLVWWSVIAVWYLVSIGLFWFLTIPYRLLRRGARQRKQQALRHQELLETLERQR
jgi:Flp pilus assembly protein TadB